MPTATPPIGAMRCRLTLQEVTYTRSATGDLVGEWVDAGALWGDIRPRAAAELPTADQQVGRIDGDITIHYRPLVAGTHRFRCGSRILNLVAPRDPDGRKRRLLVGYVEAPGVDVGTEAPPTNRAQLETGEDILLETGDGLELEGA